MRVSALQMSSGADVSANLATAERLLRAASRDGAQLALLPENFAFMGAHDRDKLAHAEGDGGGPIQAFLSAIALELRLWVLAGTVPLAAPEKAGKVFAASLLYDAAGVRVARYDKIHLFDVRVGGGEQAESYRESSSIEPGLANAMLAAGPKSVLLGLSVCYDLRFPELYRLLAAAGALVLVVPSAFTEKTGEAHWEILLRARAIENQCFVVAAGQCGEHPGGRRTWGHSMIVDPWGCVLAQKTSGEGVVTAELDLVQQRALRQSFPVLGHRRL